MVFQKINTARTDVGAAATVSTHALGRCYRTGRGETRVGNTGKPGKVVPAFDPVIQFPLGVKRTTWNKRTFYVRENSLCCITCHGEKLARALMANNKEMSN